MSTIEKLLAQKQQLMEQLKRTWSERARGGRATSREDRDGTDLARTQRSRRSRQVARGVLSTANIGTYLALTLFPVLPQGTAMRSMFVGQVLALAASTSMASAQPVRWTTYTIPETGTSVDFPSSVFSEEAGQPDGYGRRFQTSDGRSNITIQAAPNVANDSPAAFLAKKNPPPRIQYKRVTPASSRFPATRATRSGTTAATSRGGWSIAY
jgi:hypothetical protein